MNKNIPFAYNGCLCKFKNNFFTGGTSCINQPMQKKIVIIQNQKNNKTVQYTRFNIS